MSSSKFISGLFIGASAGLLLGILFAPDKGSATRKRIADTVGDLSEDLKEAISELSDGGSSLYANSLRRGSMLESEIDTEWSV